MPAIPHSAAGPRIEPPVSDPVPPSTMPDATAAPVPDDEPEVKCSGFQGLRAGGQGRSNDGPPMANSCVDSLPIMMPPAALRRALTWASLLATLSISSLEWAVV